MARPYVDRKKSILGKRIDVDNFPLPGKYQCVDLVKVYLKFLGYNVGKTGNANELRINKYKTFDKTREQIKGTNDLMQGDIIIRGTKTGYHVAIFDHFINGLVVVIEQNGQGDLKNTRTIESGNGLGGNVIREQAYKPNFWTGAWRCKKIFENLQEERAYIDAKLKRISGDTSSTLIYRNSIRKVK